MRELVLGQVKINENINKKLLANDKSLESLNVKLEALSSTLKNQSSFNKKVESLLAQIATSVPVSENVIAVTTRGGKSTRDPPHPKHAGKSTGNPGRRRTNGTGRNQGTRKGNGSTRLYRDQSPAVSHP